MSKPGELLLVGVGVRHLAESAQGAGYSATAVDTFGDQDTRDACRRLVQVADTDGLADAALGVGEGARKGIPLICAGGLDGRSDLLQRLARRFRLCGNGAPTATLIANPRRFFHLLDGLDIPYPGVRFDPPSAPAGWLLKHAASCGGGGVYRADAARCQKLSPEAYFQRRASGETISVLFAANGRDAEIVGFNRLFDVQSGERPYVYAGAVTWSGPDDSQRRLIADYVQRLARTLALRGINGLDLVMGDGPPLLLELNARPTASLELWETQLPGGGIVSHLAACAGRLPSMGEDRRAGTRGYRVLFVERNLDIPSLDWPPWAKDRPLAGTGIPAGSPLCTVHADGAGPGEVERLLAARSRALLEWVHDEGAQAA